MNSDNIEIDRDADDTVILSEAATKLINAAAKLRDPLFAVVDGAHYGHLPQLLDLLDLPHRSLFLDHADESVEAASGWLVPISGKEDLTRLLEVSSEACDCLVLWTCPLGEDALHRHLRTINVVQIPADATPGYRPPSEVADKDKAQAASEYASVLFRHYDPNVLASLIPLLDIGQFARLFGPATSVLMYEQDFGGLRYATRPEDLPMPPRGPLVIDSSQIAELELGRRDASTMRIAEYLKAIDPIAAGRMSDNQLRSFVKESEKSGRELGLQSELAMGYWGYLQLRSSGQIAQKPFVRDYLLHYPQHGTADDKICTLMSNLSSS